MKEIFYQLMYLMLTVWNGHKFSILALAVNESHLFSIDGLSAHGVQYLIMWSSLSTNYEALRRLRFNGLWEPSFGFLSLQSRRLHRVRSIQGIRILGSKLRVRYGHLCDKYRELVDRGVCSYRSAF